MSAETSEASAAAAAAAASGREAIADALAAAEKVIAEAGRRAEQHLKETEKVLRANLERLKDQASRYSETARESVDDAQKLFVERVNEQPVTATFIALGVGFVLGVLFSGSRR
ncbi:MAG: DUF883 family protein [Alphaproteobacteria bacterium]|jgi:ElaB/YqjD/DUF883 family membrane-anchored ribosome-binding protein|nr:DUF883 family protein [Alphaproteobacteria bacterium]